MQYSEPVAIQTRSQSHNKINAHVEHLVKKKTGYLVLNEEKRKQGNKKVKLTELLHLRVKTARRSNDDNMTLVPETSHKQNHCGIETKKRL